MSSSRHLVLLATCFLMAVGSSSSRGHAARQDVAKENQKVNCQGETCATITGTIDDRKLPPRKDRPFLVTLYPAPYGESLVAIAAGAGQIFTLPLQKPGSYVISVSGYTNECWIRWKKTIKLHPGELKRIKAKPAIVPDVVCE